MKIFLLPCLLLLAFPVFAQQKDGLLKENLIYQTTADKEKLAIVTFQKDRFFSPDGHDVFLCLKDNDIDYSVDQLADACINEAGKISWENAKSFNIPGISFIQYELKFSDNGIDKKTGKNLVKVELRLVFKAKEYI